jgi:RES domain-containing protein
VSLGGGGEMAAGGRWNGKGNPVVYSSTTIALATLETLAHTSHAGAIRNAFLINVSIPPSTWKLRETISASQLDFTWLADPPGPTTIDFGNTWLNSLRSPLLLVPSVIVPEEFNVLINPRHPATSKISATVARQYIYDRRLSLART